MSTLFSPVRVHCSRTKAAGFHLLKKSKYKLNKIHLHDLIEIIDIKPQIIEVWLMF